jgi:hypothetical protein
MAIMMDPLEERSTPIADRSTPTGYHNSFSHSPSTPFVNIDIDVDYLSAVSPHLAIMMGSLEDRSTPIANWTSQ